MIWHSASDFIAMGGYGPFVWGAYLMAAVCIATEPLLVAQRHRRARGIHRRGDER